MLISRTIACGLLVATAASQASAFPIPFSADPCPSGFDCYGFKAGPVTEISEDAPPALQAFQVGEDIYGRFDIHDSSVDEDPAEERGSFSFPDGGFQLGGLRSGATLDVGGGIELDVNQSSFLIGSEQEAANAQAPIILDQVDFSFGFEAFPEPDDLLRVLAGPPHLFTESGWLLFPNLSERVTAVSFFDGQGSTVGMSFGAPSQVPLPASLPLLLVSALAVFIAGRRLARG